MDISDLCAWLSDVEKHLNSRQLAIAAEILKELKSRTGFLLDVGLDYLSLNRSAGSLSVVKASGSGWLPRSVRSWLTCCISLMNQHRPPPARQSPANWFTERTPRCRQFRDRGGT